MGSNTVDVFVKTDPEESELIRIKHGKKNSGSEELVAYPLGSKIIIDHLDFQIGGGGTNTAVAFSRLGLKTGYLGKIGRDKNGLIVFSELKKEGIEFLGTLGQMNGYSVILDSVEEDRTILTYKGCNNNLKYEELHLNKIKSKAYYFSSMMKESFKTMEKLISYAKKQKAITAFNPSSYQTKQGINKLKKILSKTDVLIFNEEEARQLGGFGTLPEIAKRLQKYGPKNILITKGKDGIYALDGNNSYEAKPKPNLRIHETTGAGDSFGSTYFAGKISGKTTLQSIKMAMLNAESVITHYGAKNKLLTKKEMTEKIKKDKRTIKCSRSLRSVRSVRSVTKSPTKSVRSARSVTKSPTKSVKAVKSKSKVKFKTKSKISKISKKLKN